MAIAAAQFVGDIPKHYDEGLGPILFEGYAADLAKHAASLAGSAALELAAGTGILTRQLRKELPLSTRIIATDLNAPMLDIARSKLEGAKNIEFRTADAMALPFADQSFDLIVCQYGVMFFPDKAASFREARRVLKAGGHYVFNVWASLAANPFAKMIDELGQRLMPASPPQFYKIPFGYHDLKTISSDLAAGGLRPEKLESLRLERSVEDWPRFARGLIFGNPFAGELDAAGVPAEDVLKTLISRLREDFGAEPAKLPLEAIVVIARRD